MGSRRLNVAANPSQKAEMKKSFLLFRIISLSSGKRSRIEKVPPKELSQEWTWPDGGPAKPGCDSLLKGYNQQEGIYYDETFGPVIKMATEDIKHVALRSPIDGRRTSLNPTDYVKQFSGLARIRVTENREERKRALPLKCPSHDAAWAFIASMRLSGPLHSFHPGR
ncbi:hypothetical protein Salat_2981900 [Sesamum alatum]|uniref:Uncharacterized protein n=1 Tax=Sesamum alatum TaxID=300844 RepID=A0AAE1XJ24_9LAMI|nr:hypothetical protein Salat_2981900 [Sesamum alatum]